MRTCFRFHQDLMVGDEASQLRQILELTYPMENGVVRSWEDRKHVWNYTFFEKLKIDPTKTKVARDAWIRVGAQANLYKRSLTVDSTH